VQGFATWLLTAGFDAVSAHHNAVGEIYALVQQQATLLAYADVFRLMGYMALVCMPVALLFQQVKRRSPGVDVH
jgi:DHA2 family multidrug resistance protein